MESLKRGGDLHLDEEALVWHFYGEAEQRGPEIEAHLAACSACRQRFETLKTDMNLLGTFAVPDSPANYGEQVWQRLVETDSRVARRRRGASWFLVGWRQWAAAGLTVALIAIAFFAGRVAERAEIASNGGKRAITLSGDRLLAAALSDHFEMAERTILPVVNADAEGSLDIQSEQQRAQTLLASNRLYRQAAEQGGQTALANVLEDLERVLIEVAHSTGELGAGEAEQLRQRIEKQELLFRLRVLGERLDTLQKSVPPQTKSKREEGDRV